MLGDGMVSFGVAPVTQERRIAKSSPKIVSDTPSLLDDLHRGGA